MQIIHYTPDEEEIELENLTYENVLDFFSKLDWDKFQMVTVTVEEPKNVIISGSYSEGLALTGWTGKEPYVHDFPLKDQEDILTAIKHFIKNQSHDFEGLFEPANPYQKLTVAQLVDFYREKLENNRIEFTQMRKEMESYGILEHKISKVIWVVDNEIQRHSIKESANKTAKSRIVLGVLVIVLGVLIHFIYDTPSSQSYFAVFLVIGSGISLLFSGLSKRN